MPLPADRLRAAYRTKAGVKLAKLPDGKIKRSWDGNREWRWLLVRKISGPN